jgi:hypothetical protein
MKKLHTLLIALLPLACFAQEIATPAAPATTNAGSIKLGLNVGATYAGLRGNEEAEKNDGAVDFLFGISVEVPLSNNFAIIGNVNYERLAITRNIEYESIGDPFDPIFTQGGYDTRLTLQHFTMPVNLKYYIGASKGFYLNGGPWVRYYLGESVRINGEKVESSSYGVFQDLSFGVNLGAGMRFSINEKNTLSVELRDNLGLSNISRQTTINGGSVKTNSVNLIVSWQVNL